MKSLAESFQRIDRRYTVHIKQFALRIAKFDYIDRPGNKITEDKV